MMTEGYEYFADIFQNKRDLYKKVKITIFLFKEYSEMLLISNFRNFHETSLGAPENNFRAQKIYPIPPLPPCLEYRKNFFFEKKFLFTRI